MHHIIEPKVGDFITPSTLSVAKEMPIASALSLMERSRMRHLPVQSGHRIVGVLSDRNARAAALSRWASAFTVEDVMSPHPAITTWDTSLYEALDAMPDTVSGCLIVRGKEGDVAGIFTAMDALRAFHALLMGEMKETAGGRGLRRRHAKRSVRSMRRSGR